MKRSEAGKLLAVLATNSRQANEFDSDATIEAWYLALIDVPYDAGMWAVQEWIRHNKWVPFPAEIRELIARKVTGMVPAEDAWRLVLERMKVVYPGHPSWWSDWDAPAEVQQAVKSIGGIRQLMESTEPRKDQMAFTDVYERLCERRVREVDLTQGWQQLVAGGDPALASGERRIA